MSGIKSAGSLLFGIAQTTRIPTALLMAAAVAVPLAMAGLQPGEVALAATPFLLSALGGFALNDYHDADKDRVNNPGRAIPEGRVSRLQALRIGQLLLATALVVAVARHEGSRAALGFTLLFVAGMWCYNLLVRRIGALKTVYTAAVSSLLFWYPVVVLGYDRVYFLFPVAVMLFILGREILMDVRDVEGDRRAGTTTLPMILGEIGATRISFGLQLLGIAVLAPLVLRLSAPLDLALLCVAAATIVAAWIAWRGGSPRQRRRVILLLWVPMVAGLAMLVT